jgi:hypothetical protein
MPLDTLLLACVWGLTLWTLLWRMAWWWVS